MVAPCARMVATVGVTGRPHSVLTIVRTDPLRLQLACRRSAPSWRGPVVRVRVEGDSRVHGGRLARLAGDDEANRTRPARPSSTPRAAIRRRPSRRPTSRRGGRMALLCPRCRRQLRRCSVCWSAGRQDGTRGSHRPGEGKQRSRFSRGCAAATLVIRAPGDLTDGAAVRVRTE